jgi:hypothetical protein
VVGIAVERSGMEEPDHRHRRLLPPRRGRPRRRTAEQRDELAAHSFNHLVGASEQRSATNSRRLMPGMGSLPGAAAAQAV